MAAEFSDFCRRNVAFYVDGYVAAFADITFLLFMVQNLLFRTSVHPNSDICRPHSQFCTPNLGLMTLIFGNLSLKFGFLYTVFYI